MLALLSIFYLLFFLLHTTWVFFLLSCFALLRMHVHVHVYRSSGCFLLLLLLLLPAFLSSRPRSRLCLVLQVIHTSPLLRVACLIPLSACQPAFNSCFAAFTLAFPAPHKLMMT
ncbi:hypothetical protein H112_03139 [Trichophyton rubrum D6]|uniref:Uncharacterized protein n=3 Tax=Trichophyton TaxID=5550 RepID=A0A080WP23_TRIRC|nr:uncharacterized protein TERG_12333 [Trichophyton rubrum CBS 118892]EZF24265.1 hypothetical protein H100_03144 [Trichophyton rubrum MR850]EZF43429.1 hypothetical protein H102_03138 [Trichophyton rubrum CBS 100081]EZF54071.1 hypothetical protein H103_03152 [Trichophyton rubrum CBS 288.86]EZF75254.1 hypothetical protein H105_03157 [Trichophyton soudanense CBS 452.61]EZF85976.1 hypothetical protein H110_03145 [Trichophyton rubrum MR1448]EZF96758.1 hypothetical protein H113_03154 [Trichophyton 